MKRPASKNLGKPPLEILKDPNNTFYIMFFLIVH